MTDDDIDRVLSEDDSIVPSSGFAGSVMERIRREAAVPPPIPFPWRRAWPGFAGAAVVLVAGVGLLAAAHGTGGGSPSTTGAAEAIRSLVGRTSPYGGPWLAVAVVVTVVSIAASKRLASGRA